MIHSKPILVYYFMVNIKCSNFLDLKFIYPMKKIYKNIILRHGPPTHLQPSKTHANFNSMSFLILLLSIFIIFIIYL